METVTISYFPRGKDRIRSFLAHLKMAFGSLISNKLSITYSSKEGIDMEILDEQDRSIFRKTYNE